MYFIQYLHEYNGPFPHQYTLYSRNRGKKEPLSELFINNHSQSVRLLEVNPIDYDEHKRTTAIIQADIDLNEWNMMRLIYQADINICD